MARAVRLQEVPRDLHDQPLVGGFFAVAKNEEEDRLIFDRRPANGCERRLNWLNLPSVSLLRQVFLRPHEGLRGSGDDLECFYYCLAHEEEQICRNAVGRSFTSGHFELEHFGIPLQTPATLDNLCTKLSSSVEACWN